MNRAEFFDKLSLLDEQRLKTALWNVYWRAAAPVRERIEAEIRPEAAGPSKRPSKAAVDPRAVRDEVQQFADLARGGSYIAGDRRVSPGQRTRWRSEFARLANDARTGLRAPEPDHAATALEKLIDLACETRHYDSEKETTLAAVVSGMLTIPDNWTTFAGYYLDALDHATGSDTRSRTWPTGDLARKQRAADLAEWHAALIQRLADTEAEDLLDKLTNHPALAGPELEFIRARLAHQRRDLEAARALMTNALTELPGHREMLTFAIGIDAPLPERAREIAASRA
ncbi:MAG: hypothetical protein SYR96_20880 [Actinomycetota bacterium]|nr:hypothetical protein [Actinomycetota bacterium]